MTGIHSRRNLIHALSEAAEIEHALLCQYLFAGYSIRRYPADDLTPARLKSLQDWARTILLVAREEMEHLGTVCNLLASIGAAPNFRRPNFPQPAKYFGQVPAFSLERFSLDTILRFTEFEKPEYLHLRESIARDIEKHRGGIVDVLATVLQSIAVDGLWHCGEAWISDDTILRLAAVWSSDIRTDRTNTPPEKDRTAEIGGGPSGGILGKAYTSKQWASAADEVSSRPSSSDINSDTETNTVAAIPVLEGDRVLAVLLFRFTTYLDPSEDDAFVKIVFDTVNAEDEVTHGPNRLAQLLGRHFHAGDGAATARPQSSFDSIMPPRLDFSTIGGFYRQIRKGFLALGTNPAGPLFIGPPNAQVTSKEIGLPFPGWHNVNPGRVTDLSSAVAAIDQIIIEGEGASEHTETSHYGRFRAIGEELAAVVADDPTFEPSVAAASNPVVRMHSDLQADVFLFAASSDHARLLDTRTISSGLVQEFHRKANITLARDASVVVKEAGLAWSITDTTDRHVFAARRVPHGVDVFQTVNVLGSAAAIAVADLFNATYETMLLMLIRLYGHTDDSEDDLHELARIAFLPLMTQVLRPLAEVLFTMPAMLTNTVLQAGPTFEVYRDLPTLPHRDSAWTIFAERLQDVSDACGRLCSSAVVPERLHLVGQNLSRIAGRVAARTSPHPSSSL